MKKTGLLFLIISRLLTLDFLLIIAASNTIIHDVEARIVTAVKIDDFWEIMLSIEVKFEYQIFIELLLIERVSTKHSQALLLPIILLHIIFTSLFYADYLERNSIVDYFVLAILTLHNGGSVTRFDFESLKMVLIKEF